MRRILGTGACVLLAMATDVLAVNWPIITLTPVVGGLSAPTDIVSPRDGSGRLFVVQQSGQIMVVVDGAVAGTLLNISGRVLNSGEQGLLGMAVPTGIATGRHFYVCYTDRGGTAVISRFWLVPGNNNLADPNSEEQILRIHHPFANHNGGQIGFSPFNNSNLYIGMGDGGSANDPSNLAQNASQLLGKMLRIGVEPPNGASYTIPPDNPFVGVGGVRPEIWALGLRNPWRWTFDRLTGDLYIADVGQDAWEEVDVQPASSPGGQNYGWRVFEGNHCTGLDPCNTTGLTMPVAEYSHAFGCSITGGKVYRGVFYSYMYGAYLYADYCSGRLWGLKNEGGVWSTNQLLQAGFSISSFGEDEDGRLYVCDHSGGRILRVDEIFTDADGDRMYDSWETFYGLNTNSAADARVDTDGDGALNIDEFLTGTDPTDPNSIIYVQANRALPDFDGDGRSDISVFRPSTVTWYVFRSTAGPVNPFQFGTRGDLPVPGDYDRDGRSDVAVFRPSTVTWYVHGSTAGSFAPFRFGTFGDLPVAADYDGDGRTDVAIYRPSTMTWFIFGSSAGPFAPFVFGAPRDIPIPADYDGDGRADPAVFRPSTVTWYRFGSTVGSMPPIQFGGFGDLPIPADYDGDGHVDLAVFRPSTVTWYIVGTSAGPFAPFQFGAVGDRPLRPFQ